MANVLDLEFRVPSGGQVKEPFDAIVAGESRARQAQMKSATATIQNLSKVGMMTADTGRKIDSLTLSTAGFNKVLDTTAGKSKMLADSYKGLQKAQFDQNKMMKAGLGIGSLLFTTFAQVTNAFPRFLAWFGESVLKLEDFKGHLAEVDRQLIESTNKAIDEMFELGEEITDQIEYMTKYDLAVEKQIATREKSTRHLRLVKDTQEAYNKSLKESIQVTDDFTNNAIENMTAYDKAVERQIALREKSNRHLKLVHNSNDILHDQLKDGVKYAADLNQALEQNIKQHKALQAGAESTAKSMGQHNMMLSDEIDLIKKSGFGWKGLIESMGKFSTWVTDNIQKMKDWGASISRMADDVRFFKDELTKELSKNPNIIRDIEEYEKAVERVMDKMAIGADKIKLVHSSQEVLHKQFKDGVKYAVDLNQTLEQSIKQHKNLNAGFGQAALFLLELFGVQEIVNDVMDSGGDILDRVIGSFSRFGEVVDDNVVKTAGFGDTLKNIGANFQTQTGVMEEYNKVAQEMVDIRTDQKDAMVEEAGIIDWLTEKYNEAADALSRWRQSGETGIHILDATTDEALANPSSKRLRHDPMQPIAFGESYPDMKRAGFASFTASLKDFKAKEDYIKRVSEYLDKLKETAKLMIEANKSNEEKLASMSELTVRMSDLTGNLMQAGIKKDAAIMNKAMEVWKHAEAMMHYYEKKIEELEIRFDETNIILRKNLGPGEDFENISPTYKGRSVKDMPQLYDRDYERWLGEEKRASFAPDMEIFIPAMERRNELQERSVELTEERNMHLEGQKKLLESIFDLNLDRFKAEGHYFSVSLELAKSFLWTAEQIASAPWEFVRFLADSSESFEQLNVRAEEFTDIFDEEARTIAKTINDISRESGALNAQTLESLRDLTALIQTSDLSLQETRNFLIEYQRMMVVYQQTGTDTVRVAEILNKAVVENRLSGEDLALVYQEAPELFEKFADSAAFAGLKLEDFTLMNHKTLQSFRDLADQGKLDQAFWDQFITEITRGSKEIDNMHAGLAKSSEVASEQMQQTWGELVDEMARLPLFLGPASRFGKALGLSTQAFDELDRSVDEAGGVINATSNLVDDASAGFYRFADMIGTGLLKVSEGVNKLFDDSATALKKLGEMHFPEQNWDALDYIFNIVGLFPEKIEEGSKELEKLADLQKEVLANLAQHHRKMTEELGKDFRIRIERYNRETEVLKELHEAFDKFGELLKELQKEEKRELETLQERASVLKEFGITYENIAKIADESAKKQLQAAADLLVAASVSAKEHKKLSEDSIEDAFEAHKWSQQMLTEHWDLQKEYRSWLLLKYKEDDEQSEKEKRIWEQRIETSRIVMEQSSKETDLALENADKHIESEEKLSKKIKENRELAISVIKEHKDAYIEATTEIAKANEEFWGFDEAITAKAAENLAKKVVAAEQYNESLKEQEEYLAGLEEASETKSEAMIKGAIAEEKSIQKVNNSLEDQKQLMQNLEKITAEAEESALGYAGAFLKDLEEGKVVTLDLMHWTKLQGELHDKVHTKIVKGHKIELRWKDKITDEIKDQNKELRAQGKLIDKNVSKNKTLAQSGGGSLGRFFPTGGGARSFGFGVRAGISEHQEDVMHDVATKIAEGMSRSQIISDLGVVSSVFNDPKRLMDIMFERGLVVNLDKMFASRNFWGMTGQEQLNRMFSRDGSEISSLAVSDWDVVRSGLKISEAQKRAVRESLSDGVLSPAEEAGIRSAVRNLAISEIDEKAHPLFKNIFKSQLDIKDGIVQSLFEEAIGISDVLRERRKYRDIYRGDKFVPFISDEAALKIIAETAGIDHPNIQARRELESSALRELTRKHLRSLMEGQDYGSSIVSGSTGAGDRELQADLERRNALLSQQINLRESFARSIARQVTPIGSIPHTPIGESTFMDAPLITTPPPIQVGGGGGGVVQQPPPYVPPPSAPPPVQVDVGMDVDEVTQAGLNSTDVDTENAFNNAEANNRWVNVRVYEPITTRGGYSNPNRGSGRGGNNRPFVNAPTNPPPPHEGGLARRAAGGGTKQVPWGGR